MEDHLVNININKSCNSYTKVVTTTNQMHNKNQKTYILNYGNVCLTSDTLAVLMFVVCHGPRHIIESTLTQKSILNIQSSTEKKVPHCSLSLISL